MLRFHRLARGIRLRLLGPGLLLVLVVCFYWRLTLTGQYELFWSPDLASQVLPWMEVSARQWASGTFPSWDPHLWAGQPLAGQAQPGVLYPLNWLLFSIPLKNGHFRTDVLHWYFVLIHYMAALACYALCRDLGRTRPAAITGGLIFSLSALVGSYTWPQMLNGAVWTPLAFLFFLRVHRSYRPVPSAALCGLCLGVSWLSGHHQIPLLTTLAVFITWAFFIFRHGRFEKRLAGCAVIAAVIAGLTMAVQVLPAREFGILAKRWVNAADAVGWNDKVPYTVHEMFSLQPGSVLGIILPGLAATTETFVGIIAVTLAIIAVLGRQSTGMVKLFAALGIGAFLFSMGGSTMFHGLFYALVPGLEKARTPAAAVALFGVAVAVLASYGLDHAARRRSKPLLSACCRLLLIGAGLISASLLVFSAAKFSFDPRIGTQALWAGALAWLLWSTNAGNLSFRGLVLACPAVLLLELSTNMTPLAHKQDPGRMAGLQSIRGNADIANFLRAQEPGFRINTDDTDLAANWAAYHGFDATGGYLAGVTNNLLIMENYKPEFKRLFGTRFWISKQTSLQGRQEIFTAQSGLKVFLDPGAFPRAWVVHRTQRIENHHQLNWVISNELEQLRHKALVRSEGAGLESCTDSGEATYERPSGDVVVVTANLGCKGMVVVSDTWVPGWKADIDGQTAEVLEVNGAMRGIVVPAGSHRITMRYRPVSMLWGSALSALGLLGTIALCIPGRRSGQGSNRSLPE